MRAGDTAPAPRIERVDFITSPANPTLKLARSLERRRVRRRERALLVEGTRAISGAVAFGARLRAVLVDASRVDEIDEQLLDRLREASPRTASVERALFAGIADTEHPQPVIAICEMPDHQSPVDCSLLLALDRVRDPGNVGTLIRTAAAAGADAVMLLPGTVDMYNAKAVRASAGSIFALPTLHIPSLSAAVSCFAEAPDIVVAAGDGEQLYDQWDWRRPVIVVVGGEADGVSEQARSSASGAVRIPMAREIESLNAAVAGGILLYEAARQRRQP